MEGFCITLEGDAYSERKAAECIASARRFGVTVKPFQAVDRQSAQRVMRAHCLEWTWAHKNTAPAICPKTGLRQHPYGDLNAKIGCSMSHYLLWLSCEKPMLILEHDAVFIGELPDVEFDGICMVNDPLGATPHGRRWSEYMQARGPGIFPCTRVMDDPLRPDGLAGNSAYMIKPWAARELVRAFHKYGVWPNDAMMCAQLFPFLQELYPFVTRVAQERSTTCV